ncbi:MAG: tyrosine-type recombinase/integrase [Bacteroidetes bacterium]|nr:tyrosine-type recombinase/integrase [Bacteroidota bacterium]
MKQLPLYTAAFVQAEKDFREWLEILGYAPTTVYYMPNFIREFLHWMEQQAYFMMVDISAQAINEYYQYLKSRPNMTHEGSLSNAYLNKHQQAIKKFCEYLRRTHNINFSLAELTTENVFHSSVDVLTVNEVNQMLASTQMLQKMKRNTVTPTLFKALQYRDRAMIAVIYGCGVRRNEAVQLDVHDISFQKSLLHIRSGKNYTERIIPISKQNLHYMETYLHEGRPVLLKDKKHEAFFISARSKRIEGQALLIRLKHLIAHTDDKTLQQKRVTLHTLRHSVATHLLSAGMQLERIKDFLGHSSLESTQIYTHLTPYENSREKHINPVPVLPDG